MSEAGVALPIPYTAEEVGRTFAELLATLDFAQELHDLGIGKLSVFKRSQARRRFKALCIALWRVALEKSFPNDADAFYDLFITTHPPLAGERKSSQNMRDLVAMYNELLQEKKDADFSKVAENLADTFSIGGEDRPKQQLKLSLRIRSIYDLIFAKLI